MPSTAGSSLGHAAYEDDGQPRRARGLREQSQRGRIPLSVAVRGEQGAEGLAQVERLPQVAPRVARAGRREVPLTRPGRERGGIAEPLALVLEVDGVDERLHEPKRLRRGFRYVVAGSLRHLQKYFTGVQGTHHHVTAPPGRSRPARAPPRDGASGGVRPRRGGRRAGRVCARHGLRREPRRQGPRGRPGDRRPSARSARRARDLGRREHDSGGQLRVARPPGARGHEAVGHAAADRGAALPRHPVRQADPPPRRRQWARPGRRAHLRAARAVVRAGPLRGGRDRQERLRSAGLHRDGPRLAAKRSGRELLPERRAGWTAAARRRGRRPHAAAGAQRLVPHVRVGRAARAARRQGLGRRRLPGPDRTGEHRARGELSELLADGSDGRARGRGREVADRRPAAPARRRPGGRPAARVRPPRGDASPARSPRERATARLVRRDRLRRRGSRRWPRPRSSSCPRPCSAGCSEPSPRWRSPKRRTHLPAPSSRGRSRR